MNRKIGRRKFLNLLAVGAASLSLCSILSCTSGSGRSENHPNIFLAIADDWSWPHAGVYGDHVVKTPTFDQIAQKGILFSNAYVSAPSCTPSRGALLTGQHFWRLAEGANLWSRLPSRYKTYPDILEENGYFVGSSLKGWSPGKKRDKSAAGEVYDSFKDFLQKRPKGKPFCFWFGSHDPHRPYTWQNGVDSGMKPDEVVVPPFLPDNLVTRTDICDYYWEVERFDRQVGEHLRLLEESGELENTLIVMTSDNGFPFPRAKCNLYDFGTRVPLAVQWTDRIEAGQTFDKFVSLIDLAPTFLSVADIQSPSQMTGKNLLDIFEQNDSDQTDQKWDYVLFGRERHTPAQSDNWGGYPMRGLRNQDFLYIHNFKPDRFPAGDETSIRGFPYSDIDNSPTKDYLLQHRKDRGIEELFRLACAKRPAEELYDLSKDKYQLHNVAQDPAYSEILVRLRNLLEEQLAQRADPRVLGKGDLFDHYPYYGVVENKSAE